MYSYLLLSLYLLLYYDYYYYCHYYYRIIIISQALLPHARSLLADELLAVESLAPGLLCAAAGFEDAGAVPAAGGVSADVVGFAALGKGQLASELMGSLQVSCFLTEVFFPNLSKFITFAAAPFVLTRFVRNRGAAGAALGRRAPRHDPRGHLARSRQYKFIS